MIKPHTLTQTMAFQEVLVLWLLGEVYFRENDGFRDFNGPVDPDGAGPQAHYGSDDAGGVHQFAPMAKNFGNCQLI